MAAGASLAIELEVLRDAGEPVGLQIMPHQSRHLPEIPILAHLLAPGDSVDPGLVWVELPGMEVHHVGSRIMAVPMRDGATYQPRGELAEVVAPSDRNIDPQHPDRGERNFEEGTTANRRPVRELSPPLASISPQQQPDARVVAIPGSGQNLERPGVRGPQPVLRQPVTQDLSPGCPLEGLPARRASSRNSSLDTRRGDR